MSNNGLAETLESRILVVDDQEANVRVLQRILDRAGYVNVWATTEARAVEQMVDDLDPDLVMLDLHMPHRDGFAILRALSPRINKSLLSVLVLTGDGSSEAKRSALALGARDFLSKPFDATEALLRIHNLLETKLLYGKLANHNALLETRVAERTAELNQSQLETLERLARTSEIRDDETGRHTARVGELSGAIAEALGLGPRMVEIIRSAAPLHDIGKIGVPDSILLKPGPLSPEEMAVMRSHTVIGARILSGGKTEVMQMAEKIALSHHERWDGSGYPHQLSGEEIPVEARIVAVADCVDALTHNRPYRQSWPLAAVFEEVERSAGSHFDPAITETFLSTQFRPRIIASPPHPWPGLRD